MVEAFQTGFGSDIYTWFLRVPSLGIFLQFFTVKSVKTTSQSEGNVDTPHPQPMVSGALVPQTIVFNSQPSKGLPPHPTTPAGPAPQPSGCQHASPRGTSSGTTIMHQDRGMIFLSHALSSRLIYNHRALRCRPTPPRYSVLQASSGRPFYSACILATCKPKLCKPMLCPDHILSLAPELSTYGQPSWNPARSVCTPIQ